MKRARHTRHTPGRLCGNLDHFSKCTTSKISAKNPKLCTCMAWTDIPIVPCPMYQYITSI
eukprot:11395815-Ditylum_brightwellii.AAC.1